MVKINIDWSKIWSYIKSIDRNKLIYGILTAIIIILGCLLVNQCNKNSSLNDEIDRQQNNILAITDTLKNYKDELGRSVAERHAYQLTQEELRDTLNMVKKKNTDVVSYTNATLGVRDTIYQTTYIDRTTRDTLYLDNGNILVAKTDTFGKSSRDIKIDIPYTVDSQLHTGDATINLNQNIFVESWIEKNSKTKETMVYLRSDYPNVKFNSGMGIVATTSPSYEKSFRKTKGIGINIGPQVGVSYDMKNKKIVPTIGIGIGIGFNFTPKALQW